MSRSARLMLNSAPPSVQLGLSPVKRFEVLRGVAGVSVSLLTKLIGVQRRWSRRRPSLLLASEPPREPWLFPTVERIEPIA